VVEHLSGTGSIIRGMTTLFFVFALAGAQAAASSQKIEIVSATGCLREATSNNWTLANATDPVPSSANAPSAKEVPAVAPSGKNEFKLIGVSEFNLPAYKDHAVIVKGLLIKATPTSRLNITSITNVSPSCAPRAGK
jgi:hypothetical protein